MAVYVRDLLKRVLVYRMDLLERAGDEYGLWAIRETIRNVCRQTGMAMHQVDVSPLLAETHNTTLSILGNEITRINTISISTLPGTDASPTKYLGSFDAGTGEIDPYYGVIETIDTGNANLFPVNSFYIASNVGDLEVDDITVDWMKGDIILSNGDKWIQYKKDQFKTVAIVSKPSIDRWSNHPQSGRSIPSSVAKEGDVLTWYNPPRYDCAFTVNVSVVPNYLDRTTSVSTPADFETCPLPVIAEGAIIAGALEIIMRTPGEQMSIPMAESYKREFARELSGLKAMALLGSSGSAFMQPPNFTGRANKYLPWVSTSWGR